MKDHIERLFAHLEWANGQVLAGLRGEAGEDPQALEYFAHILGTEQVWLSRIEQRPAEVAVWPRLSLDECASLASRNIAGFRQLISGLTTKDGERSISYRNSAGQPFVSQLDDILLHVALHGAYHRGQVSLMVRRSGGTPVPTDYIAFVRGAPAATRTDRAGS